MALDHALRRLGHAKRVLVIGAHPDDEDTDLHATPVSRLMGRKPKTVGADALAVEAAHLMEEFKISSLVVVDGERRVVGALNIHDLSPARVF